MLTVQGDEDADDRCSNAYRLQALGRTFKPLNRGKTDGRFFRLWQPLTSNRPSVVPASKMAYQLLYLSQHG
jgi:hypothetical protein